MDRMPLEVDELKRLVRDGLVDTVLTVFPDLQGRFMGKRVMGDFFCDHVLAEGIEACNYLLGLDVDMTPLPGYRFASWEQGYGDFHARPDLSTLRLVPWLEKTALVICDLFDEETGEPVEVAPRQILKRQLERAAALGYRIKCGTELEFYLFKDSYEDAAAKGYRLLTPHSDWNEDYHIFQTTRDEYMIRQIRNGMAAAGVPVEFSKGEAGRGQHEINIRYAEALQMADTHAIYKNGAKEIAALNGRALTFMAKQTMTESGSSCHIHTSLWSVDGDEPLDWSDEAADHLSPPFRQYLGGLLATSAELSLCLAPHINSYKRYVPGSWAPTAIVWGHDNRTCGLRLVGHGPAFRVESRIPGADCNPYIAIAATIAGGLHGIENNIEPTPPFNGNAYEASDVPRVPTTLVDAIAAFENSEVAAKAFGDDVHYHLLNTARQEWATFNSVVTDWELRRSFEQL
jgi:glutamine synthetase